MNQVPVIVRNSAYVADVELDEDEVDPVDLAPLVSGNDPIVTAPASEDEEAAEDVVEDEDEDLEEEDLCKTMQDVLEKLEDLHKEVEELNKEVIDLLPPSPGGACTQQPPVVPRIEVWDTGRPWEREYRLHPDSSIDEISSRLFNQVADLLQIMHERISQQTWNEREKELIDGLNNIYRSCT